MNASIKYSSIPIKKKSENRGLKDIYNISFYYRVIIFWVISSASMDTLE